MGRTLALAACSGDTGLRQLNTPRTGPDEFRIVPNEPLQEPENYTFLPAPTPGGGNLGDPNPAADAVAALGGNPAAVTAGGAVPARDGALVTQSSRYGVTPQIRQVLADADAKFRKQRGRFSNIRIVPVDRYNEVYETFALDPFAEAERWRQTGRRVPAAPPTRPQ